MEFVLLILLLGTLLYGSYYDWKSREVSDGVWIPNIQLVALDYVFR